MPREDDALHAGLRRQEDLAQHKRRGSHHLRNSGDLFNDRIVIGHMFLHPFLDNDMRGRSQDLALNVLLKTGHDADRADEGRDAEVIPGIETNVFNEIVRFRRFARR